MHIFSKYLAIAAFAVSVGVIGLGTVHAAVTDKLKILGFSQDGLKFAFETYGVGDGAGIPYSTFTVVDVAKDSWIGGSPFRSKEREGSTKSLKQVRQEMRNAAKKVLRSMGPLKGGVERYSSLLWDFTHNGRKIRFSLSSFQDNVKTGFNYKVWQLNLTQTSPEPDERFCPIEPMKGMKLELVDERDGSTTVLSKGERVPKSRGCPQNYRIEKVFSTINANGKISLAILIRYATFGFEGNDGKVMVVTHQKENTNR